MKKVLDVDEFLSASVNVPLLDVRSPAEFLRGHISGAINLPLFSNEERAEVGIAYKKEGRRTAVMKGLELVGPKMAVLAEEAAKLASEGRLLVYCWRGGMRSASMAWLFQTAGIASHTLKGGYRAYRRHLKKTLSHPVPLIIIGGMTGSGKTETLQKLNELGRQVIDLEELSKHRGSAFGALGRDRQPTTEQFENDLYRVWNNFDHEKDIFIEDESKSIGSVHIPDELYRSMKTAPVIALELPLELRLERLVREYSVFPHSGIEAAILRIRKKLGGLKTQQALDALRLSDYRTVARIALEYYDKAYRYGLSVRESSSVTRLPLKEDHSGKTALNIVRMINSSEWHGA